MDLDTRTLSLCGRCFEGCADADLTTHAGRRLCPDCLEVARTREEREAATDAGTAEEASREGGWLRAIFSSVVRRDRR